MPDPDAYALDSAANALRVVALLRTHRTVTVTDVSRELGVGKSTAHRLLSTLVAEGFALRDPVHRRYHPGRALVELGLSALEDIRRRSTQEFPLTALAQQVQESVKILILDGQYARTIQTADGSHSGRAGETMGSLLPANTTAGGKVLLSGESLEALKNRFNGTLPSRTADSIADWDALMDELRLVRERGWASNIGEANPELSALAVPVLGHDHQVVAALSVVAPVQRMTPENQMRILRHLFATAFEMNPTPEAMEQKLLD